MKTVALALVLVAASGCKRHEGDAGHEGPTSVEVHCVKPTRQTVEETTALRGRIEPPPGGDLSVASQVTGRVVTVSVKEGDHVAAGDLVATVDDAPSRDALRQAEAALAQARATDVNAQAALERTKALVTRGIAARQELEDATARAEASREGVTSASAAADLARRTLGRVQVRSSFAGLVTRVFRGAGALVDGTAATPIVQLAATAGSEFVADVTQRELLVLAEGQNARGTIAGSDLAIEGVVRARPRALDAATGLGTVRVALTSAGAAELPVGAFARLVVTTGSHEALAVVPAAALRGAVSDGAEVAVCAGEKAKLVTVKVGWRDDAHVEVVSGLGPDDSVATDHVLALDDDTPIKRVP